MIEIILKNQLDDKNRRNKENFFDFEIQNFIIPSPRIISKLTNLGIEFSNELTITTIGDFKKSSDIKMLQDFYHLLEPNWNKEEFLSHIKLWLEDGWKGYEYNELILKIEDIGALSINNPKLEEFVKEGYRSQAYLLEIKPNKIKINAWSKHGAYYAFLTLSQLYRFSEKRHYLPECEIIDYPDYEFRGIEDDISRGQRPTIEHFKEFIKYLSRLKLNAEALYIEDMFKFEHFPSIGKGRNPLTKEEIKELEEYALEYFVEIQPAVEMFGHMDNMLTLPEFMEYAEFPGGQCFDISSSKTRKLVDTMLKEFCEAFSSDMIHLVCDESFDFGLWNSKEYIQKKGKEEVLAEWYIYLVDTVQKYGKSIAGFAHDIIIHYPKTLELVKERIPLILFWSYSNKKKYPTISKLVKKGFEVAAVPTTFDWSRHYPYSDYAEKNTIYMGKDGLERGAKFLVTSKFGDLFNENLRENIRYGLAIESQAAWNVNSPVIWDKEGNLDCNQLKKAFVRLFFGTDDMRIMNCMDILNRQNEVLPKFPNGMMNRYWMDPYVRKIDNKELKYQLRFIRESSFILQELKKIRNENLLKRNVYHLDYIEFAARMALHYGVKILSAESAWRKDFKIAQPISINLEKLMEKNLIPKHQIFKNKIKEFKDLVSLFEWLSMDILDQKETYKKLWLNLAVKEGLEYPYHRFEVLNWYYRLSIETLSQNQKPTHSQLNSEWIWRSGRRTSYNWGNRVPNYFIKEFSIQDKVKKVIIQGIANNMMILNLNGKKIGEIYSRFSMSQLPMAKSVQWFDITNNIKINDNNLLCIEGWNYPNGIGGINILIHIEYENGKISEIISDESWKFSSEVDGKWPYSSNNEFDLSNWQNARSFGSPPSGWNGPISKPNWNKNWKSEISFSFGLRNYVETSIVSFVGESLFKLLFWLVPLGTKFAGTDIHCFRDLNN